MNYAFWGKCTCFMTVVAVGVVAIPSSVFAAGFSEHLRRVENVVECNEGSQPQELPKFSEDICAERSSKE